MPEQDEIITLIDEDNIEHDVIIREIVEIDGHKYAIVLPVIEFDDDEFDEDDEEEYFEEDFEDLEYYEEFEFGEGTLDAFVLKIDTNEDGEEILVDVADEEWEKVKKACTKALERMIDEESN